MAQISDCMLIFHFSHLGPILQACLHLINRVSIVQKVFFFRHLFIVPVFLQGCGSRKSINFCPLFLPPTKPFCMQIKRSSKKKSKNSIIFLATPLHPQTASSEFGTLENVFKLKNCPIRSISKKINFFFVYFGSICVKNYHFGHKCHISIFQSPVYPLE